MFYILFSKCLKNGYWINREDWHRFWSNSQVDRPNKMIADSVPMNVDDYASNWDVLLPII